MSYSPRGGRVRVRTTSSVTSVKISEQSEEIFLTASHQGEAFGLSHPLKGMARYEASRLLNGTKAGRFGEYPASGFCLLQSRYGRRGAGRRFEGVRSRKKSLWPTFPQRGMGVGERAEGLKESEAGRKVFGPTFLQKGRGQKEEKICREV